MNKIILGIIAAAAVIAVVLVAHIGGVSPDTWYHG